ncbi:TPA: alpha-amylase [Candidatus Woesearchaeota archaeon]|nr:glycoside hydrolase family 57 protein [Candidatus Woesearchaeota archaeon]HIH31457.1 alpha-amylase [Candidatus Woesearchaeota archaeon]HIH54237.1 alpha-amylase [Candidatus Woesearchaeota archaeon]HIJ02626.1 alpha-amylase [Candidatus Woesearchaeota archaeon]HIJ14556.1 alpha-amylase [Candidatus Woesearchaeota archaeon]
MNVCIYFQVHQPFRMKKYSVFDIGQSSEYFDDNKNKEIMHKIAKKCYLRTNNLMLQLINKYKNTDKQFKISYSITGTALEQFQKYAPEVLESFQKLAETGNVEFLSETYYHSLSCLYSKHEFKDQIDMHKIKIKELFNQEPKVFRNTELIFNNELANFIQGMGYKAILAEGADHILGWRSPNYVYTARTAPKLKLLLKNYKLSDDIAFRFGQKSWKEYPLTAEKFAHWINSDKGHSMNLFMDYETFGEHQWDDTGIFDFLKHLPDELFKNNHTRFLTVSELAEFDAVDELDIHNFLSWADIERDLSAWKGNNMQDSAMHELYAVEKFVKETHDKTLIEDWRKLTTSDHFYYMCTKYFNDGDVHKYFNPYDTPYESYINFMNILNDIIYRIKRIIESKNIKKEAMHRRIHENPVMLLNE